MGASDLPSPMSLYFVKARLRPGKESDLEGYLAATEGVEAGSYEARLKEAVKGGHRSGATLYFAVEGYPGGDPVRAARDLLGDFLEIADATLIDATAEEGDDDEDERPRKAAAKKREPKPRVRSRATAEED